MTAKSAAFPASSEPTRASSPTARAAITVAPLSASAGVIRWSVQASVSAKGRW